MKVHCPHCQNPIEIVDDANLAEIDCPSCGSSFSLLHDNETISYGQALIETLGRFELIDEVGAGAFGSVFKAKDTQLDRIVAIKIPRRENLTAEQSELFFREARSAAQLNHSNIVSVHEVGKQDDTIFIVSDFIEGVTLADHLSARQLSCDEAASLCVKIARAVQHAHENGIVHRDLKPGNIMLDAEGNPYIMDFGLAKRDTGEITMTVEGRVLGTPAYMSPEQAAGDSHAADHRSDVYSLGVILFQLVTGERPFRGNQRMLIHQVIHDDPPSPRQLNNSVPRNLETICLKCLHKDPDRRFENAAELADDLERHLKHEPIKARPVSKFEKAWLWCKRRPGFVGSVLAIAGVIVVATAALIWQRAEAAKQQLIVKTQSVIESLESGSGKAIPIILSNMDSLPSRVLVSELREGFANSTGQQKLGFAYGLAHFGEVEIETILSGLIDSETEPEEVVNIVTALRHASNDSLEKLNSLANDLTEQDKWIDKAKLAIVALHLGDQALATDMLTDGPVEPGQPFDPVQRTVFIREFSEWSGPVELLTDTVSVSDDKAFCSGICLALGGVKKPGPKAKEKWQPVLAKWYRVATDNCSHSSSGWALSQWNLAAPEITPSSTPPSDRDWWHEPNGLRLVKINAGNVTGEYGPINVDDVFWLSDSEITVGLFRQFMADKDYHAKFPDLKPNWDGPRIFNNDDSAKLPVQSVSWYDSLLFCNWLSNELGLDPCYELKKKGSRDFEVTWKRKANGIRLPTEAEWEYACRAGTTTRFGFGDDENELLNYGWFGLNSNSRTHLIRSKYCNALGLFDIHGNVNEWCWDLFSSPLQGSYWVFRGGGWDETAGYCTSSFRTNDLVPSHWRDYLGFRVAQGPVSQASE